MIDGIKFLNEVIKQGLQKAKDREDDINIEVPDGHLLLKGLHHTYLVEIKNKKTIGKKVYYETYVREYWPNDDNDQHIGERHNVLLSPKDNRKKIVILSH